MAPENLSGREKISEAEHIKILLEELRRRQTPEDYLNSI
jgi:hypothetical protein